MKKLFFLLSLLLTAGLTYAQETVMNVQKTDGTTSQTRVADLDEISFLTVQQGGQGLIVKTIGGETVGVLFETNPVVSIARNKLTVKYDPSVKTEFEISNIQEILFGDASEFTGIKPVKSFSFVLQDGGAVIRDIPEGVIPQICTIDGRVLPTPQISGNELRLTRESLGSGVFVLKVGSFSTKIKL